MLPTEENVNFVLFSVRRAAKVGKIALMLWAFNSPRVQTYSAKIFRLKPGEPFVVGHFQKDLANVIREDLFPTCRSYDCVSLLITNVTEQLLANCRRVTSRFSFARIFLTCGQGNPSCSAVL